MDKNSIIGIILIVILMGGFTWWSAKNAPKPEPAQTEQSTDSILKAQLREDSIRNVIQNADTLQGVVENDSVLLSNRVNAYGAFASAAEGEEKTYVVESEKLKLTFSSKGGHLKAVELKEFQTYDKQPLILFEGETNTFGLSFFTNNRLIETNKMFFEPTIKGETNVVSSPDGLDYGMRLYASDNGVEDKSKYIEFLYHIPYDDYMVDFTINTVNVNDVISSNNGFIELGWSLDLRQQEKLKNNRLNGINVYYRFLGDDKVDDLSRNKDGHKELTVKTEWVSFKQQFFTTSLINKTQDGFMSGRITSEFDPAKDNTVDRYIKTMSTKLTLPYYGQDTQKSYELSMYFGPNKFKELKKYKIGLEDQINLGRFFLVRWINKYVVILVFNFLEKFISSYGIVILILTILLKIVLFPITYKSYVSSAKTRALKPEIDEIAAKYPNKDDAMKKQQATMEMYRKFGVNPMSGCLPMLLQFPILIAMFRFFPVSFELRQQPFLWAHDLSAYDSILDLPFKIPFYGDHVSLFALLMAVSTIIYTTINNKNMGQQSQPFTKVMTYGMPIMFLGLFNNYSSGLSYYYFLVNMITFLQMFIIAKMKPTEKLRAEILAKAALKKSKPKKKSKWQKRLEEMQKMQQQQARNNVKRR